MDAPEHEAPEVTTVRRWVADFVVGLDLCPFAAGPLRAGRIRFTLTRATTLEGLVEVFVEEMLRLIDAPPAALSTTLLVVPEMLADFDDYLDAYAVLQGVLEQAGLEGVLQVVSFHPDYRFEGEDPDDPSQLTNRSPHPLFHLLREDEVSAAIDAHPDPEGIPARNVAKLRARASEAGRREP